MGRRALRNISRNLDLSTHLISVEQLPIPWHVESLFGRRAPLEVEIGTGKGMFLVSASSERPEHNFLGIEIAQKYAHFAATRLLRAGANFAKLLHGDAQPVFQRILPDESVHAVHIYFPDPWWKRRHHRRRVMNEVFLRNVQRVLMAGGQLHFWTDVEEYFQLSLEMIAAATRLRGPFSVAPHEPSHDLDYQTHFERRSRQHGVPVYRARFERAAGEG